MSLLGLLAKMFGYAAAPVVNEVEREASEFIDSLQDEPSMPLSGADVRYQREQAARAAHAFPPPVAPPRPLPAPPRGLSRYSSSPPPPMSEPPPLPPPPPVPAMPAVPRPPRRRQ